MTFWQVVIAVIVGMFCYQAIEVAAAGFAALAVELIKAFYNWKDRRS